MPIYLSFRFFPPLINFIRTNLLTLTPKLTDVGYRQIALGLAAGNVIMIFADRQCAEGRGREQRPQRVIFVIGSCT